MKNTLVGIMMIHSPSQKKNGGVKVRPYRIILEWITMIYKLFLKVVISMESGSNRKQDPPAGRAGIPHEQPIAFGDFSVVPPSKGQQ